MVPAGSKTLSPASTPFPKVTALCEVLFWKTISPWPYDVAVTAIRLKPAIVIAISFFIMLVVGYGFLSF
jgi:hypothetical protein